MKIGVIHYNFPGYSFTDYLKYASETGYGYVELFGVTDILSQEKLRVYTGVNIKGAIWLGRGFVTSLYLDLRLSISFSIM